VQRIRVIDSHTEGEPTRVIVEGGPDLGGGSAARQRDVFHARFDHIRRAVVREPRGADFLVGAMIVPPEKATSLCGVIFFNNVGFLNACGHGTIGLAATLRHLGRVSGGTHTVETPVGDVSVTLGEGGSVEIVNVPSFRHAKDVEVEVDWRGGRAQVVGDVAWGGNWFFLVKERCNPVPIDLANLQGLTEFAWAVREGLERRGVRGDPKYGSAGAIDHIELFGPPTRADCRSKNFVLCPGREYDRSPCGTGTSAKIACLAADGVLGAGEVWGQESTIGSRFGARYALLVAGPGVLPMISGSAFVTAESTLILDDQDPFRHGI
jgi:4-hydroxyproline epimerase